FALSFALAILTKMHTVFVAPFLILYLLAAGKIRLLWRREVLSALGFIALLAGPYSIFAFKIQSGRFIQEFTQGTALKGSFWTVQSLLFYPLALGEQLGPLVLWPSLAYLGFILYRRALGREALFLFWILACYVLFVPIAQKAPRF